MIMVVTQFLNKTGKKKLFFNQYLTKLWANVCLDRVKNPVSIYTLWKGALVPNDALIVPN